MNGWRIQDTSDSIRDLGSLSKRTAQDDGYQAFNRPACMPSDRLTYDRVSDVKDIYDDDHMLMN